MFQGKYHLIGVIGEGTYGRVYKATKGPPGKSTDGLNYAVKMIKKSPKETERPMVTSISTLREVKLLRELKHPNVVNLTDVLVDVNEGELALVFEYAEWTMRTVIDFHKRERRPIPVYTIKSLMWQALKGLQYTHENWVIHRDLKPQNVLIIGVGKHRGLVQIADFGLARIYQNPVKPLGQVDKTVVTLWYRAPELLLGSFHYTTAVDVWSMGCIFADLLLADNHKIRALFPGKEEPKEAGRSAPFEKHQCDQIFTVLGLPTPQQWPNVDKLNEYKSIEKWQFERGYPTHSILMTRFPNNTTVYGSKGSGGASRRTPESLDLLSKMLTMDPSKRITAKQALEHPYFTEEWPKPGMNSVVTPSGNQLRYPIPEPKPLAPDVAARQKRHAAGLKSTNKETHIIDQQRGTTKERPLSAGSKRQSNGFQAQQNVGPSASRRKGSLSGRKRGNSMLKPNNGSNIKRRT